MKDKKIESESQPICEAPRPILIATTRIPALPPQTRPKSFMAKAIKCLKCSCSEGDTFDDSNNAIQVRLTEDTTPEAPAIAGPSLANLAIAGPSRGDANISLDEIRAVLAQELDEKLSKIMGDKGPCPCKCLLCTCNKTLQPSKNDTTETPGENSGATPGETSGATPGETSGATVKGGKSIRLMNLQQPVDVVNLVAGFLVGVVMKGPADRGGNHVDEAYIRPAVRMIKGEYTSHANMLMQEAIDSRKTAEEAHFEFLKKAAYAKKYVSEHSEITVGPPENKTVFSGQKSIPDNIDSQLLTGLYQTLAYQTSLDVTHNISFILQSSMDGKATHDSSIDGKATHDSSMDMAGGEGGE